MWRGRRNLGDAAATSELGTDRGGDRLRLRGHPARSSFWRSRAPSLYGLSALFYGGITVKDGKVEQTQLTTLRISEMPKVEVIVAASAVLGRRRRATIFVARRPCSTILAATGKRIRRPLKDHNISIA